jgi:hypothetical protein
MADDVHFEVRLHPFISVQLRFHVDRSLSLLFLFFMFCRREALVTGERFRPRWRLLAVPARRRGRRRSQVAGSVTITALYYSA